MERPKRCMFCSFYSACSENGIKHESENDSCADGIRAWLEKDNHSEICEAMLEKFGRRSQIEILIEELAEMQQLCVKTLRCITHGETLTERAVLSEYADVIVCLEYLRQIHNLSQNDIQEWVEFKLQRTAYRYLGKEGQDTWESYLSNKEKKLNGS